MYAIRSYYGSVFQISNQQTLGESELEIIHRLGNVISTIVEQEHNARLRLFEKEGNQVIDRIYRAYGILKYCNMLNSTEAMNLLSMLRFASDIGMLSSAVRPVVDQMMMDVQPSHLRITSYNVCYTKLLRNTTRPSARESLDFQALIHALSGTRLPFGLRSLKWIRDALSSVRF